MAGDRPPVVALDGVERSFGAVRALAGVDLACPPGRFLVTVALDLIFPVKQASTINSFLLGSAEPPAMGEGLYLVPRIGFEAEAFDHRLRLRCGGYLEPPFLAGSQLRPHGTLGFELFLFDILAPWSVSASVDVAARYLSMSFGIGWWT